MGRQRVFNNSTAPVLTGIKRIVSPVQAQTFFSPKILPVQEWLESVMNDDHYFIGSVNDVFVCSDDLVAFHVEVGQSIKVHSA